MSLFSGSFRASVSSTFCKATGSGWILYCILALVLTLATVGGPAESFPVRYELEDEAVLDLNVRTSYKFKLKKYIYDEIDEFLRENGTKMFF